MSNPIPLRRQWSPSPHKISIIDIPNELLCRIMEEVVPDPAGNVIEDVEERRELTKLVRRTILQLSLVCRSWHQMTKEFSKFYTRLDLEDIHFSELCLQRCGPHRPLHLRFSADFSVKYEENGKVILDQHVLQQVLRSKDRFGTISLFACDAEIEMKYLLITLEILPVMAYPNLTAFHLAADGPGTDPKPLPFGTIDLPKLRILSLNNVKLGLPTHPKNAVALFPSLKELHLKIIDLERETLDFMTALLRNAPSVQVVKFNCVEWGPWPDDLQEVIAGTLDFNEHPLTTVTTVDIVGAPSLLAVHISNALCSPRLQVHNVLFPLPDEMLAFIGGALSTHRALSHLVRSTAALEVDLCTPHLITFGDPSWQDTRSMRSVYIKPISQDPELDEGAGCPQFQTQFMGPWECQKVIMRLKEILADELQVAHRVTSLALSLITFNDEHLSDEEWTTFWVDYLSPFRSLTTISLHDVDGANASMVSFARVIAQPGGLLPDLVQLNVHSISEDFVRLGGHHYRPTSATYTREWSSVLRCRAVNVTIFEPIKTLHFEDDNWDGKRKA